MTPQSPRSAARRPSARHRILRAAAQRFYADGINATGIDTVTAQAGVAKMSLYNNFSSKADLVEAYIEARHEEWLTLYRARAAEASSPQDQILSVFDAYIDHASTGYEHGFRGCGLLNAAAELPVGNPGRDIVRRHKEHVEELLIEQLRALTDKDSATELGEHLSFLLEGAMARSGLEGEPARLRRARTIAIGMIADLNETR